MLFWWDRKLRKSIERVQMKTQHPLEFDDQAVMEVVTLIPRDASAGAPGMTTPVHQLETRVALRLRNVQRMTIGDDSSDDDLSPNAFVTATFPLGALPWTLSRGDWIRRQGDDVDYEIVELFPDGVSHVTAVVEPVRSFA
jgi:hypothetical protein